MNIVDLLAFLWMPFVTSVSAIIVVLFGTWLLLRHVEDVEARSWIQKIRSILIILTVFGFLYSALQTSAVHLPRSTIDRSLSDEQQEALEKRIEENEGKK